MPVCALFLRGACTRDDCKYRHVKVSSSAQVCQAFLKGFCADGASCRLKHELPPKKSVVSNQRTAAAAAARVGDSPQGKRATSSLDDVTGAKRRRSEDERATAATSDARPSASNQENVSPVSSGSGGCGARGALASLAPATAPESAGLSIRPTIRFRPKNASGFPSLFSVRNALSS